MAKIQRLGHTGLYCNDLAKMRDFYTRVMGLTVTDEDAQMGMVFLSSQPEVEHHELLLRKGRTAPLDVKLVDQIAWRLSSVAELKEFNERFKREGVKFAQKVTHGNALGIYFFDPEGNRNEVYYMTGVDTRQPFREEMDYELPAEKFLDESKRIVAEASSKR